MIKLRRLHQSASQIRVPSMTTGHSSLQAAHLLFAEWLEHWGVTFTSAGGDEGCIGIKDLSLTDDHGTRTDATQTGCQHIGKDFVFSGQFKVVRADVCGEDSLPLAGGQPFDEPVSCSKREFQSSASGEGGRGETSVLACSQRKTRKLVESYVRVRSHVNALVSRALVLIQFVDP